MLPVCQLHTHVHGQLIKNLIQIKPNYTAIADSCNLWRNYDDINDSWDSVYGILQWFGDNQDRLSPHHGPGHWNDPDMVRQSLASSFY